MLSVAFSCAPLYSTFKADNRFSCSANLISYCFDSNSNSTLALDLPIDNRSIVYPNNTTTATEICIQYFFKRVFIVLFIFRHSVKCGAFFYPFVRRYLTITVQVGRQISVSVHLCFWVFLLVLINQIE